MYSGSDIANMKHDQSLRILLTYYKCLIDEKCLSLKYMKFVICVWKFEIISKIYSLVPAKTNKQGKWR